MHVGFLNRELLEIKSHSKQCHMYTKNECAYAFLSRTNRPKMCCTKDKNLTIQAINLLQIMANLTEL